MSCVKLVCEEVVFFLTVYSVFVKVGSLAQQHHLRICSCCRSYLGSPQSETEADTGLALSGLTSAPGSHAC